VPSDVLPRVGARCRCACSAVQWALSGVRVITLGLAEGAVPFMLDGRPVVFSESNQQLYELNESAAGLVARLMQPTAFADILRDLEQGLEQVPESAVRLIVDWFDRGIVEVVAVQSRGTVDEGSSRHLSIGNADIEIRFANDESCQLLGAPYRHLPSGGTSHIVVETAQAEGLALMRIAGEKWIIASPNEAGPTLRSLILGELLRLEGPIKLHVACLATDRGAVLLCGSPGAGKSTLSTTLAKSGFDLNGDDIALFDPTLGKVMGLAFPLTLKEGSWRLLADSWPEIAQYPVEQRKDDVQVRYLPLPSRFRPEWLSVRAIIDLDRREAATVAMSPWSKIACLRKLFGEAHSHTGKCSQDTLRAMISMVERADILRLSYGEAADAARLLERHLGA
jgi:hypothetical protein